MLGIRLGLTTMETNPTKIVASEIAEGVAETVGDKVFGESVEPHDLLGPLFKDNPGAARVVMTCVGLLGGAPIMLMMKCAFWAKNLAEKKERQTAGPCRGASYEPAARPDCRKRRH